MNIEQERDEIIKHVDRLTRMAQVYQAQNTGFVEKICDYGNRAEKAEAQLVKSKWISVKDEMPNERVEVLVTIDSAWKPIVTTAELNGYGCGDQWETSSGLYFHGSEFTRITHWMPKPEAAKEEASDE